MKSNRSTAAECIANMTLDSFWHAALVVTSLPGVTAFGLLGRNALSRAHVILEGPDGVGKTTLVDHVKYHEKFLVEKSFRYKFVKEPYSFYPDELDIPSIPRPELRRMFRQDRADFWAGRRVSAGDFYFMNRSSLSMAVYNKMTIKDCIRDQDFWYPLADKRTWVVFLFTAGRSDELTRKYIDVSRQSSSAGLNVMNLILKPGSKVEGAVLKNKEAL